MPNTLTSTAKIKNQVEVAPMIEAIS